MSAPHSRSAFTLVEMVVVLAVLSLLTLVALRSSAGIADRARFEATQRTLAEIEAALVGDPTVRSAAPQTCFLSDMGRLPAAVVGQPHLAELWLLPVGASGAPIAQDAVDAAVTMPSGWRGPYLRLAPGALEPTDGYGQPFVVTTSPAAPPYDVYTIGSLGADRQPGGTGYDADQAITIIDHSASVAIDRAAASVTGSVRVLTAPAAAAWKIIVFAYEPDPSTGGLRAVAQDDAAAAPLQTALPADAVFTYSFTGANSLTAGARAFRAYVVPDPSPSGVTDPRAAALAAGSGGKAGTIQIRILRHGGNAAASVDDLVVP